MRYSNALGSAEEVRAGLRVAALLRYIPAVSDDDAARMGQMLRGINRLANR